MFRLGPTELTIILIIVLVVFGGGLTWGSAAIHWHKVPQG